MNSSKNDLEEEFYNSISQDIAEEYEMTPQKLIPESQEEFREEENNQNQQTRLVSAFNRQKQNDIPSKIPDEEQLLEPSNLDNILFMQNPQIPEKQEEIQKPPSPTLEMYSKPAMISPPYNKILTIKDIPSELQMELNRRVRDDFEMLLANEISKLKRENEKKLLKIREDATIRSEETEKRIEMEVQKALKEQREKLEHQFQLEKKALLENAELQCKEKLFFYENEMKKDLEEKIRAEIEEKIKAESMNQFQLELEKIKKEHQQQMQTLKDEYEEKLQRLRDQLSKLEKQSSEGILTESFQSEQSGTQSSQRETLHSPKTSLMNSTVQFQQFKNAWSSRLKNEKLSPKNPSVSLSVSDGSPKNMTVPNLRSASNITMPIVDQIIKYNDNSQSIASRLINEALSSQLSGNFVTNYTRKEPQQIQQQFGSTAFPNYVPQPPKMENVPMKQQIQPQPNQNLKANKSDGLRKSDDVFTQSNSPKGRKRTSSLTSKPISPFSKGQIYETLIKEKQEKKVVKKKQQPSLIKKEKITPQKSVQKTNIEQVLKQIAEKEILINDWKEAEELNEQQYCKQEEMIKQYFACSPQELNCNHPKERINNLLNWIENLWNQAQLAFKYRCEFLNDQIIVVLNTHQPEQAMQLIEQSLRGEVNKLNKHISEVAEEIRLVTRREEVKRKIEEMKIPEKGRKSLYTMTILGNNAKIQKRLMLLKQLALDYKKLTKQLQTLLPKWESTHQKDFLFRGFKYLDIMLYDKLRSEKEEYEKQQYEIQKWAKRTL